jgi:tRNA pseudouridine13 synthase
MLDSPGRQLKIIEIPYETSEVDPIRARIKSRPEDFMVDEEPAYEPCGNGDHLYLQVEKKGWSMERLLLHLRDTLDVSQGEIGYAGLKDKHAVTRQWISVPMRCEERVSQVDNGAVRVIDTSRHTNKIRTGHLRGNRFNILMRGTPANRADAVRRVTDWVVANGMVNIYGNQRFGRDLESARVGRDVVAGAMQISRMSRLKRKFSISAIQSYLFNLYVRDRMESPGLRTVIQGDVMKKRDTGGLFVAEDVAEVQSRLDAGQLVVAGPIFGRKMVRAHGLSGQLEIDTMAQIGMNHNSFDSFHSYGAGTRRPLLTFPEDVDVEGCKSGVRLRFFLPKGCYATVLLREVLKRNI